MSLDNLAGAFDWIKDDIAGMPYERKIAWREGEDGDFDARDIVSLLTCFNIEFFPNSGGEQPVEAYEKKSSALKRFEQRPESYLRLRPILKEIVFDDTIRLEAREYSEPSRG